MKGSHSVETYIQWLRDNPDVPDFQKKGLIQKIKDMADKCSATGKQGRIDIMNPKGDTIVMALRIYPDGSLEAGVPDKWPSPIPTIPKEIDL